MDEREYEVELLIEIRQLALAMLRMDIYIRDAMQRHKFTRVGELALEREGIQQQRSWLMRELFLARKFRDRRRAAV